MAITKLHGCDMYFERTAVRGKQTLLFVHGMGGAVETWVPVRPYFLNEDCIYVDLSGHGRSSGEALTVQENAELIRSFVEQQPDIERLVYIGISYGSAVGLQLAVEKPAWLHGLVLMSPRLHFSVTREELDQLVEDVASGAFVQRGTGASTSQTIKSGIARGLLTTPLPTTRQLFELYNGYDVRAEVQHIDIPTLILSGSDDGVSDLAEAEALQRALSRATYTELPTGHFIPIEKPRETAREIKDFLATLE